MKKSHMKPYLCGVLTTALAFSLVGSVVASTTTRQATLNYSGIQLVVNGEKVTPTDANGVAVEPFAIDGTTYLPVRAIGNALGMEVGWNGDTQSVTLDDPGFANANVYSRTNPAPVGTAQSIAVDNYSANYTVTLTVTDAIRGDDAWAMVKEANMFNSAPEEGKEYIVVKVKAELLSSEDDKSVSFSEYSFDCFSAQGSEYLSSYVVNPSPNFSGSLYAGSSLEGYFTLLVDETDMAPTIVYGADYYGTGGVWFSITA